MINNVMSYILTLKSSKQFQKVDNKQVMH